MRLKVKVEGLREIEKALKELPEATGKNVLRRVARQSLQPLADSAKAMAPEAEGDLKRGIGVGARLTRRQSREYRKMFKDDRSAVEMFAGAGGHPQAHLREFGSDGAPPHPFMRPAWDRHAMPMLEGIKTKLWDEIAKAAKRLARKAKAAKKG